MASLDCLFCRITAKEVPTDVVLESDHIIAFRDIHPKAPSHVLIVPKKHLPSLAEASQEDQAVLGSLLLAAKEVAEKLGIAEEGYRLIINTRHHGGQEIDHLHLHLLGGEPIGPLRP